MRVKKSEVLRPDAQPDYETEGLLSPEAAKEWVAEIRRREAERPDLAATIDAETAFALASAILRPS